MSANSNPLVNTNPVSISQSSITSAISRVILDADAGVSSLLVQTGGNSSMYIDRYANVGINTVSPSAQLEISSGNGACLCIRYGSTNARANIFMNSSGFLSLNPSGGEMDTNGNLNISAHNGSTTGLKLGGTLITATASKINYIDTTPGTASANKALVLDSSLNITGLNSVSTTTLVLGGNSLGATQSGYLTSITPGIVGASKALVVNGTNDLSGIRNLGMTGTLSGGTTISHSSTYTNTLTTASTSNATGALLLAGGIGISNTTDASSSTNGGTLSTAGGVGIAKSLFVGTTITSSESITSTDSTNATSSSTGSIKTSGGISAVQDIYAGGTMIATVPIATTSGGTGTNSYANGDILTGTNTNTLTKLTAPSTSGYLLSSNSTTGTYWGYNYLTTYYVSFPRATYVGVGTYTFGPFFGRDSTGLQDLAITAATTSINLNTFGANGIGSSGTKTGTIYPTPSSTTITGISTLFLTDISVGYVVITVDTQTRKIVSLISDTSAVIDTPFTLLNSWTLGAAGSFITTAGQFKFGTAAFNGANATTAFALLNIGSSNLNYTTSSSNQWTVEFWLRPTALSAQVVCASATANTFRINMAANGALTLFLGQSASFNISNGGAITDNITAGTYVHLAVVFNGSNYTVYKNGVSSLVVASALPVSSTCFNQFYVGSNTATSFNGRIDEFRLSRIARYTTTFAVATAAFTNDANTMSLNHFDNTASISLSDDCSLSAAATRFPYAIDTAIYPNTVYYGYAISNLTNQSGYIFNSSSLKPELPAGYTHFAEIPFYATTNSAGTWIGTNYSGMGSLMGGCYHYLTHIPIITNSTVAAPTYTNTLLANYIPVNATKVILYITHTHVGTNSVGIRIGHNALNLLTTIMTINVAGVFQSEYILPLATQSIDTALQAVASTTNYSVAIMGFYT